MHKKNKHFQITLLLLFSAQIYAQDMLPFEEALQLTLENNYDIRLARIDEQIAENSASIGNSGYLPTLSSSGNYTWTFLEGNNQLITGEQNFDANSAYNYSSAVSLNYSIFEGQGRRYNYLLLKEASNLSQVQARAIIENTILQLGTVYYETARLQEAVKSLDETLSISEERLQRAQYGYDYGQATRLDILNAEVDLNNDSINLINAQLQLANFNRNLNLLMGAAIDQKYTVSQEPKIRKDIMEEDALSSSMENNANIISSRHALRSSELALGASKSGWWPNLGANVSYNYAGSDNPNGAFVTGSSSFGPTAGVNLNWQIFDGRNKTRVDNARLDYESQLINQEFTAKSIDVEVRNAFGTYQNALVILEAQEDNLNTAINNYERSEEAYKLGQITSVEFRQAQLNQTNATLLLSQAKYDAKNAELQLLQLMGTLMR